MKNKNLTQKEMLKIYARSDEESRDGLYKWGIFLNSIPPVVWEKSREIIMALDKKKKSNA